MLLCFFEVHGTEYNKILFNIIILKPLQWRGILLKTQIYLVFVTLWSCVPLPVK